MLIGAGLHKVLYLLCVAAIIAPVPELTAMSAELVAKFPFLRRHVLPRFVMMNGVLIRKYLSGTIYRDGPRLGYGVLQESAMVSAQCWHGVSLLNLHRAVGQLADDRGALLSEPSVYIRLGLEKTGLELHKLRLRLQ